LRRDKCVGRIAVVFNTSDDYLKWLEVVSKWDVFLKTFTQYASHQIQQGLIFQLPLTAQKQTENDMEVDKKPERKSYILNVQVKLRKLLMIKESFKTVEPRQMFMNKNGKSIFYKFLVDNERYIPLDIVKFFCEKQHPPVSTDFGNTDLLCMLNFIIKNVKHFLKKSLSIKQIPLNY
jgi:hypothetical protein